MRQLALVLCLVVAWIAPASAMPVAKANDIGISNGTVLVRGHGHHHGWGRGHHYGWWRGHHHGWRH